MTDAQHVAQEMELHSISLAAAAYVSWHEGITMLIHVGILICCNCSWMILSVPSSLLRSSNFFHLHVSLVRTFVQVSMSWLSDIMWGMFMMLMVIYIWFTILWPPILWIYLIPCFGHAVLGEYLYLKLTVPAVPQNLYSWIPPSHFSFLWPLPQLYMYFRMWKFKACWFIVQFAWPLPVHSMPLLIIM